MKKNKNCLISFAITFFILVFVLIILNVYPFGDRTLIVSDLRDQYISFIDYLKSCVFDNNNLFYTFSGSLGMNMYPLMAYYLTSFFNILTLFVKTSDMHLILTMIILVKISLSSLTFCYFLNKKKGINKINILFSLCYGLMSYNIAFYFHIMWLDAIIFMPLLILGIENIFNNKGSRLYIISLILIILSNYYIGVIACLFSVIYFIYYFVLNRKALYDQKCIIKKYVFSSLVSGISCAILLLPVFFSLFNGKAVINDTNIITPTIYNIGEILSKAISSGFDVNQIWHGAPNIFAGTLITLLVILYFINNKIPKKKKLIHLGVLIFLLLTFRIHPLDLLFHGLTEPNCFDFRHAFIFTFFMLIIAYDSYENLNVISNRKIFSILLILLFSSLFIIVLRYSWYEGLRGLFLLYSLVMSAIILYYLNKKSYSNIFKPLIILVIFDLIVNVTNIMANIVIYDGQRINNKVYRDYVLENKNVLEKLTKYDDSFYRLEKDYFNYNSINDSMLFKYNGISHFDSTTNVKTEMFLENLGFRRLMSRSYYGSGSTKAIDSLLGIKYILSKNDNFKDYSKVLEGNINVFKNNNYLGFGYAVENINKINFTNNPFENINEIYKSITGVNKDIYKKADYQINYHKVINKNNNYHYLENDSYIEFKVNISENNNLYMIFNDNLIRSDFKKAKIYINDVYYADYFDKYEYGMMDLGKFTISDEVSIKIVAEGDSLEYENVYLYYEDENVFSEMYDILSREQLYLEKENSAHLKGKISVDSETLVLLTIPYDEGFKIKVDGQEIEYKEAFDALISFRVSEGNHIIEIIYCPKGFKVGAIISLLTGMVIVGYLILERKGSKKDENK